MIIGQVVTAYSAHVYIQRNRRFVKLISVILPGHSHLSKRESVDGGEKGRGYFSSGGAGRDLERVVHLWLLGAQEMAHRFGVQGLYEAGHDAWPTFSSNATRASRRENHTGRPVFSIQWLDTATTCLQTPARPWSRQSQEVWRTLPLRKVIATA